MLLRHVRRHKGAIAAFARAVQAGNADAALAELGADDSNVDWLALDPSDPATVGQLQVIHDCAVESGRAVIEAAQDGDAEAALDALEGFRLLCAHRRGPEGVRAWTRHIERWLEAEVEGFAAGEGWYLGRPLIVTENDYSLDLFNGDVGVVVKGAVRPMEAAFRRGDTVLPVSTARLAAVDTVYAMTVHKSQGSQFDVVAFLLPSADSRILTRELLYTAATRARRAADPGRHGRLDPLRHRAADHAGLRPAAGAVGRGPARLTLGSRGRPASDPSPRAGFPLFMLPR